MKRAALTALVVFLMCGPAAAEMYRYVDDTGAVNFVDDPSRIPPQYRDQARVHVPAAEPAVEAAAPAPDLQAILAKRKAIISTYTPEQAEAALSKGALTAEEVDFLVQKGSLRTSAAGAAVRGAKAAGKRHHVVQPQEPDAMDRDLAELQAYAAGVTGSGTAGLIKQFLGRARANPLARFAVIGEGVLFLALIGSLPFILRRYHSDSHKLIKSSLFLGFVILSATLNLIVFRDDLAFFMHQQPKPATATPPAPEQGTTP